MTKSWGTGWQALADMCCCTMSDALCAEGAVKDDLCEVMKMTCELLPTETHWAWCMQTYLWQKHLGVLVSVCVSLDNDVECYTNSENCCPDGVSIYSAGWKLTRGSMREARRMNQHQQCKQAECRFGVIRVQAFIEATCFSIRDAGRPEQHVQRASAPSLHESTSPGSANMYSKLCQEAETQAKWTGWVEFCDHKSASLRRTVTCSKACMMLCLAPLPLPCFCGPSSASACDSSVKFDIYSLEILWGPKCGCTMAVWCGDAVVNGQREDKDTLNLQNTCSEYDGSTNE